MARDTSLDEFLGDESAESTDSIGEADATDDGTADGGDLGDSLDETGATDAVDADATPSQSDDDAVEPAVVTYDVSPDGAECAACGAAVTRRWCDDAGMVCGECKEW